MRTQEDLAEQLLLWLRETPAGFSEFQLIRRLQAEAWPDIPAQMREPLSLFRGHFVVFNALYRLRDRLWSEGSADLQIHPLQICLRPYTAALQGLSELDELRLYYLDSSHLQKTSAAEVQSLLSEFANRRVSRAEVNAALRLFGWTHQAPEYSLIKQRYRQLVSQHHPDRGGSTEYLQSLNQAMELLQRCYRP